MQWLVLQVGNERAANPDARAWRRDRYLAVKVFAARDRILLLDFVLADAFEDEIAVLVRNVAADQDVALVIVYR